MFSPPLFSTLSRLLLPEAGLGRRKARCMTVRFLTPPVEHRTYGFHRLRRSTWGRSPWGYPEASGSIAAVAPGLPPGVIPLRPPPRANSRGQLTRARGTLCTASSVYSVLPPARGLRPGAHPGWTAFPASDSSAPSDAPCGPGRFGGGSLPSGSTRLPLPHDVSRVPPRRRTRPAGGGLCRRAPAARGGFPGARQGRPGCPGVPWPCLLWLSSLRWARSSPVGPDGRASQTSHARGAGARRALQAAGEAPWHPSAQPPPLEGLAPAPGALQGPAAHLAEGSATLRPKGSSSPCRPEGVSTFFPAAFTAHREARADAGRRRLQANVRLCADAQGWRNGS